MFRRENPGVVLTVTGVGTGGGIRPLEWPRQVGRVELGEGPVCCGRGWRVSPGSPFAGVGAAPDWTGRLWGATLGEWHWGTGAGGRIARGGAQSWTVWKCGGIGGRREAGVAC